MNERKSMSIWIAKIRSDRKAMWWLALGMRWLIVILALVVYTLSVARAAQNRALEIYYGWFEDYAAEQARTAAAAIAADPYQMQLDSEAEEVARVLYGVKDNDSDDLRTYCWCIFNRVDNPAFPDTLSDVVAQPSQWMRYDPTNPVLEPLFQLAREQVEAWHGNSHRPVSSDFVFMNWSKDDICLRDVFPEGSGAHYWRWSS